jgi:hypothetical protein
MDRGVEDEACVSNVVGIVKDASSAYNAPCLNHRSSQSPIYNYLTYACIAQENDSILRITRMRQVVLERCQYT